MGQFKLGRIHTGEFTNTMSALAGWAGGLDGDVPDDKTDGRHEKRCSHMNDMNSKNTNTVVIIIGTVIVVLLLVLVFGGGRMMTGGMMDWWR